jgi:protoporphyrinogen/coproporphyrinogen III oxidase
VQASDDRARRRYLYVDGTLHPLPGSPGALLQTPLLPWTAKLRMLAEPFVPRRSRTARPSGRAPDAPAAEGSRQGESIDADDETVYEFAARRFGKGAAEVFAGALVSGVFGGEAHQLSMRACFPAVPAIEAEHGSLLRGMAARRRRRGTPQQPGGSMLGRLTSFREGMSELSDALAMALGPRLRTGAGVADVTRAASGFRLTLDDGSRLDADALVLACGASSSARLVGRIDAELAGELRAIASPPIAVVCLGLPVAATARPLDGFGFLAPRGQGVRLLGALWDSSVYPGRAPEDHVLVRVMMGGASDPDAADLDDETLVALVRRELGQTMQVTGAPVLARVFRHRPGIPQYTRGHVARLTRIDARVAACPGLHLIGNAFRGVSINHCIEEASTVASRVQALSPKP